jgi:predicted adenylyl cyclase CyaB
VGGTKNNLEIEVKLACENLDRLRQANLDLQLVEARHFEDNWLLDCKDQELFHKGAALRVRAVNNRGVLTYKGVVRDSESSLLKIREEIESAVDAPERVVELFERLGFYRSFRYQKYRAVYRLAGAANDLSISFDETPIGNFIEIEGDEEGVLQTMQAAGFSADEIIRESYPELQGLRCRQLGKPLEDLVF